jgi:hypothetical protein
MGTGNQSATGVISATISGTTLTVAQNLSGDPLVVGQYITGSGVTANSYITANLGNSQYTLSQSSTVSSATTMYAAGNNLLGDPAPMSLGVGPMGRLYIWDTIPQTLQTANIAASQTPSAAGNLTLTAGTSATSVVKTNGTTVIQLDVPRAVSVTQVTAGTSVTVTVSGYDYYGQTMTQTITTTAGSTVTGTKAFYQIASVAVSAGTTTAVTVGTSDVLGFPIRVIDAGYLVSNIWNNTLDNDAGTFASAATVTATSSTGDVRGTYKPSSATNGQKRLVCAIAVPAIGSGPNSTATGVLGVTQA